MEQNILTVEARTDTGKGVSRRLRMKGQVPAVIYGLGKTAPVVVDPVFIQRQLLSEEGRNCVFDLKGAGLDGRHALVKDYQVDPVSRKLLHVDLLEIDITKKIVVVVPLNYVGKSLGVAEGGVLNIIKRDIEIRSLPNKIPKHIDIDVSNLQIGDSIHLDQAILPEGVEKTTQANPTLITVVPPTKEEELAPQLTEAAAPEVITEKKPAEGEAAAAGTGAPAAGAKAGAKEGAKEGAKKEEKKK